MDYTFNRLSKEVLLPNEERFFYYDVMRDAENNAQSSYKWSEDIKEFLNEKGIQMEDMENGTLPQNVEKNVMFFSIALGERKPEAFFRHLRNAFTHHRITHSGEYLHFEDTNGTDLTMIGLIKFQDLKELCFLFFNQRSELEKNNL